MGLSLGLMSGESFQVCSEKATSPLSRAKRVPWDLRLQGLQEHEAVEVCVRPVRVIFWGLF